MARPRPLGAGNKVTVTLEDFPVTLKGIECGDPHPHSHDPHPLFTSIRFIFALFSDFLIAVPTSFALL